MHDVPMLFCETLIRNEAFHVSSPRSSADRNSRPSRDLPSALVYTGEDLLQALKRKGWSERGPFGRNSNLSQGPFLKEINGRTNSKPEQLNALCKFRKRRQNYARRPSRNCCGNRPTFSRN